MKTLMSLAFTLITAGAVLNPASAFADSCYGSRRTNSGYFHSGNHYSSGWSSWVPFRRGVQNGSLSRSEIKDLRDDQQDIRRKQREYYADGYLSRRERSDLWSEISDYRRDLNRDLHDRERRW